MGALSGIPFFASPDSRASRVNFSFRAEREGGREGEGEGKRESANKTRKEEDDLAKEGKWEVQSTNEHDGRQRDILSSPPPSS